MLLVLALAVSCPVLACYAAAVAVVALLTTTAGAGWSLAGTLRSAAPCWLAAHQVPLTVSAPGLAPARLGVLPLLPTAGLVVLVAGAAAAATRHLGWRSPARLAAIAAAFGGVHGAIGLLVALVQPAARLTAAPGPAIAGCFVVAGGAALLGGARVTGLDSLARPLAPWVLRGVRAGLLALAALVAAGALSVFAGLLLAAHAVHDLVAGWATVPGGRFGVTALSIGYLPNAAVAGLSLAAGLGLSVGTVSISAFGGAAAPLPALPLLGALPGQEPTPLRLAALAFPLAAAVIAGHRCHRIGTLAQRLDAVVTAGAVAATGCFALATLAGGRLGSGALDPVSIRPAALSVAVFGWLVIPAGIVAALPDRLPSGTGRDAGGTHPDTETGEGDAEESAADAGDAERPLDGTADPGGDPGAATAAAIAGGQRAESGVTPAGSPA